MVPLTQPSPVGRGIFFYLPGRGVAFPNINLVRGIDIPRGGTRTAANSVKGIFKRGGSKMKKLIFSALLATMLLSIPLAMVQPVNAQVNVGIRIGPPPAPRVLHVQPRRPGPDYTWIEGYWYPKANGRGYNWHNGYWTRAPFPGALWVAPRYEGGRFYEGYWENGDRRMNHDHRWDNSRDRDYQHDYRDHR